MVDLGPLDRIVNIKWGGVIIQITSDPDVDEFATQTVSNPSYFSNDEDPGAQTIGRGFNQTVELAALGNKWLTQVGIGHGTDDGTEESGLIDFIRPSEEVPGIGFKEFLVNFDHWMPGTADPNPFAQSFVFGNPFSGSGLKSETRLRIYPKGTTWTVKSGTPNRLEADTDPTYDKTKVIDWETGAGESKDWEFDEDGWLTDDDLGTYSPITEWPAPPSEEGGGGFVSTLSSVLPSLGFSTDIDGNWWPCVFEVEGVTGIAINPPATHDDGSGIISTGGDALVQASCRFSSTSDVSQDDILDIGECAILNATSDEVLASGARNCSVVYSGPVKVAVRLFHPDAGISARGSITSTYPAT